MPQYNNFQEALQHVMESDTPKAIAALDDLLKVGPLDENQFKQAINLHKEFWKELLKIPQGGIFSGLFGAPTFESYLNSTDFLKDQNPNELHQLAAEKRVMLKLNGANEEILVGILTHNAAQIRDYLAEKKLIDSTNTAGWLPAVPAPAVAPSPILTNEAIDRIQKSATELLLIQLIDKTENSIELENEKLIAKVNALINPKTITAPDLEPFQAKIADKKAELVRKEVNLGIVAYIQGLSEDNILGFSHPLKNPDFFKGHIERLRGQELTDEALKNANKAVGARYAQIMLAEKTNGKEVELINSNDKALKEKLAADDSLAIPSYTNQLSSGELTALRMLLLKQLLNTSAAVEDLMALNAAGSLAEFKQILTKQFKLTDVDFVKDADLATLKENVGKNNHVKNLTLDQSSGIRMGLLKQLIDTHSQVEDLIALDAAESLPKVKDVLTNQFKMTVVDFVKDTDLAALKEGARNRAWALKLEGHPQLLLAVASLDVAKQREFLTKSTSLNHLMNASTVEEVQKLLGKKVANAADIFKENQLVGNRAELFKQILNPALARVLMNLTPEIILTNDQIREINQLLLTNRGNSLETDFIYVGLISTVKDILVIPAAQQDSFFQAFNINSDNLIDKTDKAINVKIAKNQVANNPLLALYPSANDSHKKLFGLLISFDLDYSKLTAVQLNHLKNFANLSVEDYLGKMEDKPKGIIEKLSQNIAILRELKFQQFKAEMATPANVAKAIEDCKKALAKFDTNYDLLMDNSTVLKPLHAIKDIHLMNPGFQCRAKDESKQMLVHYRTLAEQCDLVINQLIREQAALLGYQANLPAPKDNDPTALKELRTQFNEKLQLIDDGLDFYRKTYKKLREEIIPAVENAAQGKNNFTYKAKDITYRTVDLSNLDTELKKKTVPAEPPIAALATRPAETAEFKLEGVLPDNQARIYEFAQKVAAKKPDGTSSDVVLRGVFTEQYTKNTPEAPDGTFEVKEFPQGENVDSEVLKAARVQFSLAVAAQALSSLKTMPTTEKKIFLSGKNVDEVRFLYVALLELGVDRHAIKNDSSVFDPAAEHGTLWGYSKGSIGETIFSRHKDLVEQTKKGLDHVRGYKDDKDGLRQQANESTKQAVQAFKDEHKTITKAEEDYKKEGPAKGPK